jgi:O-antigen/teichoic acid export membrane protein
MTLAPAWRLVQASRWASRITFASVAPLADFGGRFLRMIVLSRLLSSVEFGTSVALTVVISTAFMVADIGLDRFVLLNAGPQGRPALAAAHFMQITRGVVVALALVLLAAPVARMFDVPAATESFRWGALMPLIHGAAHLGPKQAQQHYNFRQDAVATAFAGAVSLVIAGLAAWLCRNHDAIIYSLLAGESAFVLATHLVADRPYEVSWDRRTIGEAVAYGFPLMVNGVGLAIMAQADRFLVGATLGVATLGVYSVILSLSVVAVSPFYAIFSGIGVSVIAKNRSDPARFNALLVALIWGFCLFGFSYAAFTGLTLDLLAPKLFGPRYAVDLFARCVIAMIAFLRIVRGPASVLFLVDGRTRDLALANLVASVGLVCAFLFVRMVPTLEAVLLGVVIGDLASFCLFQSFLLRGAPGLSRKIMSALAFELALALGLLAALSLTGEPAAGDRIAIGLVSGCLVAWMARRALTIAQGSMTVVASATSGAGPTRRAPSGGLHEARWRGDASAP